MPATNEQFIKAAFEAGLNEDQVRQAVAERNQKMSSSQVASFQQPQPQQPDKLQYQQGDNPLLYGAAKAQEFLGKSSTLPIVGGIMGKAASGGNPLITGMGTGVGTSLQRQLRPENAGMRQPKLSDLIGFNNPMSQGISPFNKPLQGNDVADSFSAGAQAAAWDFAISKVIPNLFKPGKMLSKIRDYLSKGKTVDEKVVYKWVQEAIRKPGTMAKVDIQEAEKQLKNMKPLFKEVISAKDAFAEKSKDWAITIAGNQRAGATNELSSLIAKGYREALKEAAPMAQMIDKPLSIVQQAPRAVNNLMRGASYAGQTLFGLEALRRAIGQ